MTPAEHTRCKVNDRRRCDDRHDPLAAQEPLLLADLSSPETRDLLPRIELVLVPVGAHEQHGPNIAVSTDTISADALCRAAAALVGPAVAVAPAVPWGVSWHHLRFAGTISLRQSTLIAVLEDIVGSLYAHGMRRFLVVNGHGGNTAAITTAIEQIKHDTGVPLIASVFGYALIAEQAKMLLPAEAIGHGGGDEAALVMAVEPHRAKPSAFAAPRPTGVRSKRRHSCGRTAAPSLAATTRSRTMVPPATPPRPRRRSAGRSWTAPRDAWRRSSRSCCAKLTRRRNPGGVNGEGSGDAER